MYTVLEYHYSNFMLTYLMGRMIAYTYQTIYVTNILLFFNKRRLNLPTKHYSVINLSVILSKLTSKRNFKIRLDFSLFITL